MHYIESIDFAPLAAAPTGRGAVATVTNRKWKKKRKKNTTTNHGCVCACFVCFDHNGGFWSVGHDRAEGRRSMLRGAPCRRLKP